ncbi:MAG: hypothetical protein ACI4QT_05260, partial [Kiritimatiellia bacterium]
DESATDITFEKDGPPELSCLGAQPSTVLNNGQFNIRKSWTYVCRPDQFGSCDLGSVSLKTKKKTLRAQIPPVTVIRPTAVPGMRVTLRTKPDPVILNDNFTLELLIDLAAGTITNRTADPELIIPMLTRIPAPTRKNAAPPVEAAFRPVEDILKPLIDSEEGDRFLLPDFPTAYGPLPISLKGTPFSENGTNFTRYVLPIGPWHAIEEDSILFPAVRLTLPGGAASYAPDGKKQSGIVLSDPLTVSIVPPPAENRPAGFFGASVRNLSAHLSVSTQSCKKGDPIELTLRLRADTPLLPSVSAPPLASHPAMAKAFRAIGEPARTDSRDGSSAFTYRFRPISAGTAEIPAFSLPCFDLAEHVYKTIETLPIPIYVEDAVTTIDAEAILSAKADEASSSSQNSVRARTPSGLVFSPEEGLPRTPAIPRSQARLAFLLPPVFFFALRLLRVLARRRHAIASTLRRMTARDRATARILSADTPAEIMQAVTRLLHDRYGIRHIGLTSTEIRQILASRHVPPETLAEIDAILNAITEAQFRPEGNPKQTVRTYRARLAGLFKTVRILTLFFSLSCWTADADASPPDAGTDFRWREANAAAALSLSPKDWAAVARRYRDLIDLAPPRAGLCHSYAIALLMTGKPELAAGPALDALCRAEALSGSTPELQNDLLIAYSARETLALANPDAVAPESLPWYRTLLAFHYRLSRSQRYTACAIAWALLWLFLLFRPGRLRNAILLLCFLALLFLSAGILATEHTLLRPLPDWTMEEQA